MKTIQTQTSATVTTNNGETIYLQDALDFLKKKVQDYGRYGGRGIPKEELENLFQDISIKVWKNIKRFDSSKAKLTTWLNIIAENAMRDAYMRHNKNSARFAHPTADKAVDYMISNIPDACLANWETEGREALDMIMKAINSLNENYQYILLLYMKTGMKPSKMAEIIGCSADVVATNLCRARKALKMRLGLVA